MLTFAFLLNTVLAFCQEDVFSNKTNVALEKVIRDYPNRFHNIRGEMITQNPQTAEYKSTITVPGAISRKPFAWPTSASGIISEPMK